MPNRLHPRATGPQKNSTRTYVHVLFMFLVLDFIARPLSDPVVAQCDSHVGSGIGRNGSRARNPMSSAVTRIRYRMFPITLSRGLEIVQAMANKDADTHKWYQNAVNHFMQRHGDILARDVTPDMIREWSNALDEELAATGNPYSEWTKNSYRRAIRAYFNKLVEVGHLDPPGPTARFRVPSPPKSLPKHLSDEEVERVRQFARQANRDHAMIEVMFATGCRLSDLLTMRVSSLHIESVPSDDKLNDDERELVNLARSSGLEHLIRPEAISRMRGKVHVTGKASDRKKKSFKPSPWLLPSRRWCSVRRKRNCRWRLLSSARKKRNCR